MTSSDEIIDLMNAMRPTESHCVDLIPCDMCGKEVPVEATRKIKGEDRDSDFVCEECVEKIMGAVV